MSSLITILLVVALSFTILVVVASKASGGEPEVLGYQLKTVLSGSMEPTFKTGSIIAVKPVTDKKNLKANDIITYIEEDGKTVTHRIIEVNKSGKNVMYQTQGDNNNAPDTRPVLAENVLAKYNGFTIPYIGYIVDMAQSQNGAFLLLIPGIILLCYSIFTIWQALREIDMSEKNNKEEHTQSA